MVELGQIIDPKLWTHKCVETNLGDVSVFWFQEFVRIFEKKSKKKFFWKFS